MTTFFGVIGNRDYIKYQGERLPFWEFLDEQPKGWLSSLAYRRTDMPEQGIQIGDCGAWSYKALDVPKIGKDEVTPAWTLDQYHKYFRPGAMVIAPDHMLIPGLGDLDARRKLNDTFAAEFLSLCRANDAFVPMATAHGETISERVEATHRLIDLGYKHIALGGLAGQASRRAVIFDVVVTIRRLFPDVYLHVLGLSAPSFAQVWQYLGVNSFDGASHFKQAFTAGKFYVSDGMRLLSFQAARPGEEINGPECDCRACTMLADEDIDTRMYGSNETNMGRAAHNMNHLMRALRVAMDNPIAPMAQGSLL